MYYSIKLGGNEKENYMKMLKKLLGITIVSAALCLAGCGEKPDKTVENSRFTITVGDEWKEVPIELVDGAISIAKNNNEAINVMPVPSQPGLENITIEEYKDLVEQGFEVQPSMEVTTLEIQEKEIGDVIYFEGKTTTTKEMMEQNLEAGLINEEAIEAAGGIEAFEKGVVTEQVCMYYVNEGEIVAFTAQATNGAKIDDAKAELESIVETIVIK